MKIFISADIEGVCGIADWRETDRDDHYEYNYFRRQMTLEVRAACEGAQEAGADEVFVKDAHATARNLDPAQLPEGVRVMRGWTGDPLAMMSGLDRDHFDAVCFTGCHAGAGCAGSPLAHTVNLRNESITLNGAPLSEFLMNAYTAGYYQVPVVFVSGDEAVCELARELIPDITTVAVNEGRGGAVVSIHPDTAIKTIREASRRAVKRRRRCTVTLPDHFETVVRFRDAGKAYSGSFYPGASLEQEKNVRFAADDWFEVLRFYHFVLRG